MSNEELVAAIQSGEDRMGELWAQVEKLVMWKAHRVMTALDGRGGVEFDDLFNLGTQRSWRRWTATSPNVGRFPHGWVIT